jgi:pimeloyl-ACP methyl ester carboxylesterase
VIAPAAIVLLIALAGVVYQRIGLARDIRRFPPPGQFVDAAGQRLHVVCRGSGTPTVLFEAAIAASSLSWTRLQDEVARFTTACAYDRAGLAWSGAPTAPQTFARAVEQLESVLASRAAPYILVGHSFGVFLCLEYAHRHPEHTAGLVLVDPPSEWMQMDRSQLRMLQGGIFMSRLGGFLARVGVVRTCLALLTGGRPGATREFVKIFGPTTARTLERLVGEVQKLPPEIHPVVQAMWCQPKCFAAMADHIGMMREATASAAAVESLGDMPIVVLSSSDQPREVLAAHHALAALSSRGLVVVAARSGHWIPYDEPELIVGAIRRIAEARG